MDTRFAGMSAEELAGLVAEGNVDAIHFLRAAKNLDRYNRAHSVSQYEHRREIITRARDAEAEREADEACTTGFATWQCARHASNDGPKGKEWGDVDPHWTQDPEHWGTWQKKTCRRKGRIVNHVDRNILRDVK